MIMLFVTESTCDVQFNYVTESTSGIYHCCPSEFWSHEPAKCLLISLSVHEYKRSATCLTRSSSRLAISVCSSDSSSSRHTSFQNPNRLTMQLTTLSNSSKYHCSLYKPYRRNRIIDAHKRWSNYLKFLLTLFGISKIVIKLNGIVQYDKVKLASK